MTLSDLITPFTRRLLFLIAIFHFIFIIAVSLPLRLIRTDEKRDVTAYYLLLERIKNHEPVYNYIPKNEPHKPMPIYHYPPFLSSVFALLPAMTFVRFAQVWTILLYIAFWIYAICLARITMGRLTFSGTLVAGLALSLCPGTHIALSLGQIDPILWALFGIALTVPAIKGAALMAVTLVKPWALWPLLRATGEGLRVVIGASFIAVGSLILGVLVRGADLFYAEWLTWFRDMLPSIGQGSWSDGNWSISFGVLRLVKLTGLWNYSGGLLPEWARIWLLFCGVFVPILTGFLLRRKSMLLQLSALGCSAVVFSPICWDTYLPVLLTVFSVLIRTCVKDNNRLETF